MKVISDMFAIPLTDGLNNEIDKVIIGVNFLDELKENIETINWLSQIEVIYERLKGFEVKDEKIILPINWNL